MRILTLPLMACVALACTTDGDGRVEVTGALKQWAKVTLTLDGPCAQETGGAKNPFTDYRMDVEFVHESGAPRYRVPGYFAADGNAAETSAASGTKWRAHVSPDKAGRWSYKVFFTGRYDGKSGSFRVAADPKARGRLQYVGGHYLRFAGSGEYFLKAGTDSPETLLGYADFDGTATRKTPLKTYAPHLKDWKAGDPVWKGGKGKGLVGGLNYLASKGLNSVSFLTYNAAGDGDNVWPFVSRDDKLHYDCSKLDQWAIVFEHANRLGLHLHFKLQETENDDERLTHERTPGRVSQALDGGALGPVRKLYLREIIARFGHNLMLNWNLSEESTQTPEEQRAMAQFIADTDPYAHNRVIHTHPGHQDAVYRPLLGKLSALTGVSLQNEPYHSTHRRTLQWRAESVKAGKPWVVATDEQGTAALGVPPDPGYPGFDGKSPDGRTIDDIRKQVLWGSLMAGGAGVEYYFGYKFPQNDLVAEDFRSRDKSWDYAAAALLFFRENRIPFQDMTPSDELVGKGWCLAQSGKLYVVYLPEGGSARVKGLDAKWGVKWFDPRTGRSNAHTGWDAPDTRDWVALIRR